MSDIDDLKPFLVDLKEKLESKGLKTRGPEIIPMPIGFFDQETGELQERHVDVWTLHVPVEGTEENPSPRDIVVEGLEESYGETVSLTVDAKFLDGKTIMQFSRWAPSFRRPDIWEALHFELQGLPEAIAEAARKGPEAFSSLGNGSSQPKEEWAFHVVYPDGVETYRFDNKKEAEASLEEIRDHHSREWLMIAGFMKMVPGDKHWVVHVRFKDKVKSFGFDSRVEAVKFKTLVLREVEGVQGASFPNLVNLAAP